MSITPAALPRKGFALASTMTLLGLLMVPALVDAQQPGVISGSVTDRTNKPLPGVRITLTSPDDKSLRRSAVTDAKGRYEIADLSAWSVVVTAELPGFRVASKNQNLGSGRREVWLTLEPGPFEETVTVPQPLIRILPLRGQ